ncbi:superoxide dismutase family protein [Yeosuana sp. MJ-SS3]|uniref:Superoxide dismutase family protein n=1 Tax=Gilvirhabdus luticola TaxID=3079858 RepID=A0ABU3U876_9FLAO|nr:superoxide dismutase family protein [Yeosuana sp. MJ-SS3]MDU8886496.1 superoxide dismutase family protein [Yeosuana sp. MJ-SS3]
MKKQFIFIILLAIFFVFACKQEKKQSEDAMTEDMVVAEKVVESTPKKIIINLTAKSDSNVSGTAVFTEEEGSVKMVALLSNLSEGTHAIHLHEKADCSSTDGKSTGGHWNPTRQPHGKWGDEAGYHKGDIGNFEADANGNGTITFTTDQWCIDCDDESKNIIGKAVIVHQGTDDFVSQPSGAAGSRISCGGIIE